jgi:hypothetical protein
MHYGSWVIRVYRRGAAAVAFLSERLGDLTEPIRVGDVMSELEPAWKLAAGALEAVGAAGEARLALRLPTTFQPPLEGARFVTPPDVELAREVTVGPPTEAQLDSIRRELEREAGWPTWEPEPDEG